jgi:hypothetical protein
MNPVLIKAITAATRALSDTALTVDDGALSWTDRTEEGDIATAVEGETSALALTAVSAAWVIFHEHLLEKLVESYLENRTKGIEEGRRLAVKDVEEKFSHPAYNGGQHWDSDTEPVPDWIRIAAMNAARGRKAT